MLSRLCEPDNRRGPICTTACWLLLAVAPPGVAQVNDVRLPITLDADSTSFDGKTSMLTFEGLKITQGDIGIQAKSGRASKLDFEDSIWQFSGNVIIDTDQGHIECDSADIKFGQHELRFATIVGNPATFELRRAGSDDITHARANRLVYDFAAGVVEFSGDAVITEGGNQLSSNLLVYNIKEQRINAQSAGEGNPRVKITYTPRAIVGGNKSDAKDDPQSQSDNEDVQANDADTSTPGDDGP